MTLPDSTQYGPILGPMNAFFVPGFIGDRDRTQSVPGRAPEGTYTYSGYVGVYPDSILDQDGFTFEKLPTGDGTWVDNWNNTGEPFDVWMLTTQEIIIPDEYLLEQNYPNPFNLQTTIRFDLPKGGRVHLAVYNLKGQKVIQLVDGYRDAGFHELTWDVSGLASGIYLYRIQAGDFSAAKKMVLMK